MRVLLVLIFSFSFVNVQAQQNVVDKLSAYIKYRPQEKIYLHTNKDIYSPGETIWFKQYHWDGYTQNIAQLSAVLYVDLVDHLGNILGDSKTSISSDIGGSLQLPDTLRSGTYYVRGYTSYQLNFNQALLFEKPIKIVNELNNRFERRDVSEAFDIQFFPEGGHLINGLVNTVGFKAVNNTGLGAKVIGSVIDQNGKEITNFESGHGGIGSFKIIPEMNQNYIALVDYRDLRFDYPLPQTESNGPLLTLSSDFDFVTLRVLAMNYNLSEHYVLAYQNGAIFLNTKTESNENHIYAKIRVSNLSAGMAHFTLFNALDQPISERVFFIRNGDQSVMNLTPIANTKTRKQVTVSSHSGTNQPSFVSGSATVYDAGLKNNVANNIISHFYLTSELKGHIEEPYYYFENLNQRKFQALDELMLTQGWSRYQWEEILRDTLSPLKHYLEQSPTVGGQLFDYYNRSKTRKGQISLTLMEDPFVNVSTESTEDGRFQFGNLDFGDTTTLIFQAKRSGKKPKKNPLKEHNDGYYITINKIARPTNYGSILLESNDWNAISANAQKLEEQYRQIERSFGDDVIVLDAFEVKRKKDQYAEGIGNQALIYNRPTKRYNLDSMDFDPRQSAINMRDLIASLQIPGFQSSNFSSRGQTTFSGKNEVAFFYKGRQVDLDFVLEELSPIDVGTIDYFTGSQSAIFGVNGASGVIAIYPRPKDSYAGTMEVVGISHMKFIGYNKTKEFYKPSIEPENKPDFRRALYWNPNVAINENGQATISFTTSDATGEFLVEFQGVNQDGKPVYGYQYFEVID